MTWINFEICCSERKEEGEEEEESCKVLFIFHLTKSIKQKERERICVRCSVI